LGAVDLDVTAKTFQKAGFAVFVPILQKNSVTFPASRASFVFNRSRPVYLKALPVSV